MENGWQRSRRLEPVKAADVGGRERDFVLNVGGIEHGWIRHIRPRDEVRALLQHEICRRHGPRQFAVGGRKVQTRRGCDLAGVDAAAVLHGDEPGAVGGAGHGPPFQV